MAPANLETNASLITLFMMGSRSNPHPNNITTITTMEITNHGINLNIAKEVVLTIITAVIKSNIIIQKNTTQISNTAIPIKISISNINIISMMPITNKIMAVEEGVILNST